MRFRLLAAAAAIGFPSAASAAPADTPATIVASQIGSWDCSISSPGSKEVEQLVIVWAPYGEELDPGFGRRRGVRKPARA